MISLSKTQIVSFQNKIYSYYEKHARTFPWRETNDPYKIFVSEVMLQQTQADRVVNKYNEFMNAFPGFKYLADAKLSDILRLWKGLGYNRRALWLQKSAQRIIKDFNEVLPKDTHILMSFSGIGPNTAASILTFAYNLPFIFIETNIRSVYIHEFFEHSKNVRDDDILTLVELTLDKKEPRKWYWALMDYGSYLKKSIINPSRKSYHYKKQTSFIGSDREIRGHILDVLLINQELSMQEILSLSPFDEQRIKKCIDDLLKEGLLSKLKNKFSIS